MKLRIIALLLMLSTLLCGCSAGEKSPVSDYIEGGNAVFHFIDVGQGDCTLIQTDETTILIDSGTAESGSDVYRYLQKLGIKYIDCFIATHPHEDHIGGAATILSGIDTGKVFVNKDSSDSYSYEAFLDALIEKDSDAEVPNMDCTYVYGDVRLKFLSPSINFGDSNNNSLVTMVQYGDIKALFMGDAEKIVEEALVEDHNVKADILKVGHHGSRNGSSTAFLNEVLPSVCVIQCGKDNPYGHPHIEAVERIKKIQSDILRCDESGTILLITDGKKIFDEDGKTYNSGAVPAVLTYIGNKNSGVFHTNECPNLPSQRNRIIFEDRDDAINRGYRPCGNCNP